MPQAFGDLSVSAAVPPLVVPGMDLGEVCPRRGGWKVKSEKWKVASSVQMYQMSKGDNHVT